MEKDIRSLEKKYLEQDGLNVMSWAEICNQQLTQCNYVRDIPRRIQ